MLFANNQVVLVEDQQDMECITKKVGRGIWEMGFRNEHLEDTVYVDGWTEARLILYGHVTNERTYLGVMLTLDRLEEKVME